MKPAVRWYAWLVQLACIVCVLIFLAFRIPIFSEHSTLGKTHFIIGHQPSQPTPSIQLQPYISTNTPDTQIKKVLFSPDDNVRPMLLDLIKHEQEHIRIAVFVFTDRKIAQALIDAHNRGVYIEIITDPGCLRDQYNKITTLCEHGIPTFIYNVQSGKSKQSSIMHHKFALFNKSIENKSILWTGSFNFTRSAHKYNQENVLILDDPTFIKQYVTQFERLKKRSYRYQSTSS